ncbi:hypothetical protein GGR57DRAFT_489944 [Xylariaceae sp. FL1272]|nr:hypothetical protein GGR57DRAFT_489944 [Xylariaceae sp. FL1272]
MKLRSNVLKALTERGRPSVADIFSNTFLPFIEASEFEFQTANAGVVHITNLPYEVTRQEVVALLVRTCNGKVLEERHEPVHIIMDRITGKTKDAYVEIRSHEDAMKLIENVEYKRNVEHRPPRLGSRVVNITLSSQAQLMKALFPDAQMEWYGAKGVPKRDSRFSHENFKGFFSDEEMTMLAKHTNPTHASFAKLCPERVYECMISTIRKVPWGMTDLITMAQRHLIYETALNMVATLNERLKDMDKRRQDPPPPPAAAAIAAAPSFSGNRHGAMQRGGRNGNGRGNYHGHGRNNSQLVPQHAQGVQQQRPGPGEPRDNRAPWEFFEGRLTVELRKRLVETCMMCPGFTVVQKDCFGAVAGMPHSQRYGFNLPFFSEGWTHLYALVPKVNMPADLLGYYIALIREETTRVKDSLPMSQRKVLEKKTTPIMEYFGYLWVELDLPRGPEFDNMTLRQIMKLEWDAIERVIRRALVGGIVGPQWLKDHDDD